jgi:hypothetical protein
MGSNSNRRGVPERAPDSASNHPHRVMIAQPWTWSMVGAIEARRDDGPVEVLEIFGDQQEDESQP